MANPIDFYFDFSSPYGYFAEHEDRRAGGEARPRGDLAADPARRGVQDQRPAAAADDPAQGQLHRARPRAQRAAAQGAVQAADEIPDFGAPRRARAFYWLGDRDPALAKRLAQALYHAYFAEDRDISNPEVTGNVAAKLGVDKAELDAGAQRRRGQGAAARPRWTPRSSAACSARPTSWWTASRSGARTASTRSRQWLDRRRVQDSVPLIRNAGDKLEGRGRSTSSRSRWTRSSTRPTRRCSAAAAWTARSTARPGPELLEECRTLGGCPTGQAKITRGYRLPGEARDPHGGPGLERRQARRAGAARLVLPREPQARRRARAEDASRFPAISCGVYGYPLDEAVQIAVRECADFVGRDTRDREDHLRLLRRGDARRPTQSPELNV